MSIRKALTSDAKQIRELVSALSHFYLEDDNATLPEWFSKTLEISEFERRLSSEAFSNFVYEENGSIAGYISIKDKQHLYHLFVDEKHQGKGIAKKLWASAISGSDVRSYTVRSSMYAVPVYKKFGFVETEASANKDGIRFQPMALHC